MKKNLTILMASAECRGVAKVGGLADVVFDLSSRLRSRGHRVLVVLPLYGDSSGIPSKTEAVLDFLIRFEGEPHQVRLHRTVFNGLEIHLIEAFLFQGDFSAIYVDSCTRGKGPFEDDARRFAFFSAAVWELVKHHKPFSRTQVVHCHDWHTGLIPLLVRLDGRTDSIKTLFTIHNLDYQGTRPFDDPYAPGASWRQWFPERWDALDRSGWKTLIADPSAAQCFNPIRCGIRCADAVNTVSPTYAREIMQPDDPSANFLGGRGLEVDLALRNEEGRLSGILNGLDYKTFDPMRLNPPFGNETPDLVSRRKNHRDQLWKELPRLVDRLESKQGMRLGNSKRVRQHLSQFLQEAQGLPLTVCVTRAVAQKLGLFTEDLAPGMPLYRAFLAQGTALLVLGTGELEDKLDLLNDEPTALFLQVFDADLANRLYSVGDFFLMPSDFEPCGISQLLSLRYGCLPLVHDRGGLHDTVQAGKTGFVFHGDTRDQAKEAFLRVTSEAVRCLGTPGYEVLVRSAMAQRFEWTEAVADYEAVYRQMTSAG